MTQAVITPRVSWGQRLVRALCVLQAGDDSARSQGWIVTRGRFGAREYRDPRFHAWRYEAVGNAPRPAIVRPFSDFGHDRYSARPRAGASRVPGEPRPGRCPGERA